MNCHVNENPNCSIIRIKIILIHVLETKNLKNLKTTEWLTKTLFTPAIPKVRGDKKNDVFANLKGNTS